VWRSARLLRTRARTGETAVRRWSGAPSGRLRIAAGAVGLLLVAAVVFLGMRVWQRMDEVADASAVHSIERVLLIDEVSGALEQLLPYLDGRRDPGPFERASIRAAARTLLTRLERHRLERLSGENAGLAEDLQRLREQTERLLADTLPAARLREIRTALRTIDGRLERRYRRIEQHIAREIEARRRATIAFMREMAVLLAYSLLLALGAAFLFLHARRAGERAIVNHRRLQAAIACLPDGFALYDADDRLVLCNRRYRELYPRTAHLMEPGARFEELLRRAVELGAYGDLAGEGERWIAQRLEHHRRADGRPLIQRLAGGRVVRVTEHRTPDGDRVGLRVDITEMEAQRRIIAASEARWRGLAETAPIGIWQLTEEGRTDYANPALGRLLGRDGGEDPKGAAIEDLVDGADAGILRRFFTALPAAEADGLEMVLHGADGIARHVLIVARRLERRSGGGVIATVSDITRQKRALAEVERLAMSDPLTGLANRHRLGQFLDRALAEKRDDAGELGLLLIDLDGFKEINDSFGHEAGDRVLLEVAERLRRIVREGDLVARLGGDEFALVVASGGGTAELRRVAQRAMRILARPVRLAGTRCHVGVSIGIAAAPLHGRDRAVLMRHADLALYRAKREGRGRCVVYRREFSSEIRRRRRLAQALQRALEKEEFELVFQPQVGTVDGRVLGAEILLRWYDPVAEQPVSPAEFVPVAEERGLILELDRYVLRRAMGTIASLRREHPDLVWGINISAAHIRDGRLVETVAALLREHEFPPGSLELEVTENVFVRDLAAGKRALGKLKELGVKLALDDFGTGYSSLAYLSELPFDRLKIDRSFVHGLGRSRQYRTIVRAIVGLGRRLGMETVAEGVESEAQRAFLAAEGCTAIQGYMIARPMPRRRFTDWLRHAAVGGKPWPHGDGAARPSVLGEEGSEISTNG